MRGASASHPDARAWRPQAPAPRTRASSILPCFPRSIPRLKKTCPRRRLVGLLCLGGRSTGLRLPQLRSRRGGDLQWSAHAEGPLSFGSGSQLLRTPKASPLSASLGGSVLLRLDPDILRAPTNLIPEGAPMRFADDRGTGLPAIYDAIVVRDIDAYLSVNERFRELFPTVKNLSPKSVRRTRRRSASRCRTARSSPRTS